MRTMILAVLLGALSAGTALAQGTDKGAAVDQPGAEASEKKICRRMQVTGSILAGKRVCHTRAEWTEIDRANQDALEQARRSRGTR